MEKNVVSACPLNCWDMCSFNVTVIDEKVAQVTGNKVHPVTKGHICSRGRMLEQRTNASNRITNPLKRVKEKFEEISWDQALDEIANEMQKIKDRFGPTAVFHSHDYSNSGLLKNLDQRFFNCFGGVTEVVGSLCWGAGIEAQIWDFGNSESHAPEDIFHSKQIVIWGRNAASTNVHLYANLLEAKKRNIPIIVIDPMFHQTARLANVFIPIRPGTDGLLAIGIIKKMKQKNVLNDEFIKTYSHGFVDFEKMIDAIAMSEIVSKTAVSEEMIESLASQYSNGPTSTYIGLGLQRYYNGGHTIRLIDALVFISGNVGIKGGGANYGNLQVGQSFDMSALTLDHLNVEKRTFTRMNQAEKILAEKDVPIELAFVTRGNPLTQLPDTNIVEKAFTSIKTLVVIDQFMTDTAKLAKYILPCTTVFEEEDIYYASMYHSYVNYGPRIVAAKGEARSDLWIWSELAKRLGFGEEFAYSPDEFLEMGLASLEGRGITLEKLKEVGFIKLPVNDVPWFDLKFKTPTGKFEFTSVLAKNKGEEGRSNFIYPLESKESNEQLYNNFPYQLISKHPSRSNHSQNYQLLNDREVKIEISEKIAIEHQLKDGDRAIVWNERGEIAGLIKVIPLSYEALINIDEGRWKELGGSVNVLTSSGKSVIGLGGIQYDCLVNIKKQA